MIQFAHPWSLLLAVIIPVLIWWYRLYGKNQEGTLRFSSIDLLQGRFIRQGKRRVRILSSIQIGVLLLIVLALARPRLVDTLEETTVKVVDIVMVVDISSSMLAEDFKPNRLEAVKKTAAKFIEKRPGDRIGLLVFAGETFIQCPLTVDAQVLKTLLAEVTVAEKDYDGTAIGMAIANATNRLRNSKAKSKVMVLLSDGSNNAGELDPLTAADLAAEFDIRIYTIGAGTNQSVTYIPNRGYIRNEIDEKTLQAIAEETHGRYFRATDEETLEDIYEEINQLERTEIEVREYTRYEELYGWFLIPALIFSFGFEILERSVFRRKT
ncbi:MAG TPA: VWA domain-containing protein [Candidatus Marinimicrobia bacterium]|mgnify:FL=1|jgi:Ca-activated chloride channel family protein|nr:VWA domain-containing protein [Candidatus Neomarinimicrobiota bacterium]MDP6261957.1 VWA domain-containing protein [Candidatus Neomarinimicrobiota bacterium]MDP7127789.1 VWA domain-containing protein [Candidatus Neomarinimicrobiota bacterium]MDP7526982.1 VWA domain-containing protein [Candidatus Neomarinimicrobiota bacterium]MEE1505471.1 VWA domain-containing protein [Candidatus Neomarinimicrobiota bacterium]